MRWMEIEEAMRVEGEIEVEAEIEMERAIRMDEEIEVREVRAEGNCGGGGREKSGGRNGDGRRNKWKIEMMWRERWRRRERQRPGVSWRRRGSVGRDQQRQLLHKEKQQKGRKTDGEEDPHLHNEPSPSSCEEDPVLRAIISLHPTWLHPILNMERNAFKSNYTVQDSE